MGWLALIVACLALDGFIFKCLWNWHVSPMFNLRTLNIYQGAGLTLLVVMFKSASKEDQDDDFLQVLWRTCGNEVLCFAAGLALHLLT
jgi:hypothetical protein